MGITVDVACKSLNKYTETLCGDKVELPQAADSNIMALADGMGSGVKVNILPTLMFKILGTMFLNSATPEECAGTISETLPICQMRQMAYSTFSVLQVYHNGDAYLAGYDNPGCIFIRDGKPMRVPKNVRVIQGKEINKYRFKAQKEDALILMNDGITHTGVGELLSSGWLQQDIVDYAVRQYTMIVPAMRLAASISRACNELYQLRPGDDTTVAYMRIIDSKPMYLMTGPAHNPEDGVRMVHELLGDPNAKTIVYGGISATIVSKVLGKRLDISLDYVDPEIPPIAYTDGVDLVTEGVLILSRVLQLLRKYVENETVSEEFFQELDRPNGGSMIAKVLIEDCTEVYLYVGRAINSAYQNSGLPSDLDIRQNLVEQLGRVIEEMGKKIVVTRY